MHTTPPAWQETFGVGSMLGNVRAGEWAIVQQAAAFASRAHKAQIRKDDRTPYASHVFRVAFTCALVFGSHDPIVIASAMLHDTIEDTTTDYDDLRTRFGEQVAGVVAALTKNMALPKEQREREYDERLSKGPWQARLIKLADVLDNLCDVESVGGVGSEKHAKRLCDAQEKCRRALLLAEVDTHKPEVARALHAVRTLLASCSAG